MRRVRSKTKTKSLLSSKKGETMVEILVAFVILTIVMSLFGGAMMRSMRQFNHSRELMIEEEKFTDYYYRNTKKGSVQTVSSSLTLVGETASTPTLHLSGELMKFMNTAEGSRGTRYYYETADE